MNSEHQQASGLKGSLVRPKSERMFLEGEGNHPAMDSRCSDFTCPGHRRAFHNGLGNSSWNTYAAVIQPSMHTNSLWYERCLENEVYNSKKPLPPYFLHSLPLKDSTSLNHSFSGFDQECESHNNLEGQGTLNLARFGGFKATCDSRILEEKEPTIKQGEGGLAPDVTLSLSLPRLMEPEMTKPLGSLALGSSGKSNSAQLTIFYAGNVNVYDDVPLDKAKAIMLWAGSASEGPLNFSSFDPSVLASRPSSTLPHSLSPKSGPCLAETLLSLKLVGQAPGVAFPLNLAGASCGNEHEEPMKSNIPNCPSVPKALPHARKLSLARFLERRRERWCEPILIDANFVCAESGIGSRRVQLKTLYTKKNSPQHTFSHGDTEFSTNRGAACPPMGYSDECDDDEKMSHTSKKVKVKMETEDHAGHYLYQANVKYDAESETNMNTSLA